MVELFILKGKMAGKRFYVSQFPFLVGRDPKAHLVIEEDGLWHKHFLIEKGPNKSFYLRTLDDATVIIDSEFKNEAELKNGDIIEIGELKIRFSLSPTHLKYVQIREILLWICIILLVLIEGLLMFRHAI